MIFIPPPVCDISSGVLIGHGTRASGNSCKKLPAMRYGRTAGSVPAKEYLRGMDSEIWMRRP